MMDHTNATCGILYIATGDRFADEAVASVRHLRQHMPDVPVAIATDRPRDLADDFDPVIILDQPDFGYGDKPEGMLRTPFERTLFLDTDTFIHADVSHLFDLLDRFDIAAAHEPGRHSYQTKALVGVPASFPELNTGVVLYQRNEAGMDFMAAWSRTYQEERDDTGRNYRKRQGAWGYDQTSFRAMCYHCNIRLGILPQEYNFMPRWSLFNLPPIVIEHRTNRNRDLHRSRLYRSPRSTECRTAMLAIDVIRPADTPAVLYALVHRWGTFARHLVRRLTHRRSANAG